MEFTINDMISLLWKRFIAITLCTLLGLIISFTYTKLAINPTYSSSVQLYVNSNDTTSSVDLNELYYVQKVVTTYINFLRTKAFYAMVIKESGLNYSAVELKNMTTISAVNNTEIFQISVTSNNPEDTYKLVTAMQKVAPEHIKRIKASAEISVVDPAVYPAGQSGPNLFYNTIIGGTIGFFLSICIFLLLEIMDVNVKDEDDLKRKYNKPILGVIPKYGKDRIKKSLLQRIRFLLHKKSKRNGIVVLDETDFLVTEAYNELRTNLRYTFNQEGCNRILINSPIPQDGKSTISTNIAKAIAQTGKRVLLMDCDLRKGKLHRLFNLTNSPGISELLIGLVKEKDAIQYTENENLQVITMGKIPPNPTELLAGSRMEELLISLEKNYDFIIIDSPPVNVVSDSLSLAKLVDGVILVAREQFTSHPDIASAISKMEFVEARIIGFVFNGVSFMGRNKPNYKYYHNYSRVR